MTGKLVLIIEDHPMISIMLTDMIKEIAGPEAKVQTEQSLQAASRIKDKPNVVIVDLDLPDSSGVDTLRRLYDMHPQVCRLVCSGLLGPEELKLAGELGFLTVNKAAAYAELLDSLEKALIEGGILEVAEETPERLPQTSEYHSNIIAPGSEKPLTLKQVDIMRMTAEGFSAKEVAKSLGISPDTVRGHMKEIFVRLGAKNKGQAVEIFIRAERKARLLEGRIGD